MLPTLESNIGISTSSYVILNVVCIEIIEHGGRVVAPDIQDSPVSLLVSSTEYCELERFLGVLSL
jgi:hypothetical protein